MQLKFVIAEDFVNYKEISMFIGFPYCSFKCDKDCGQQVCQNSELAKAPTFDINKSKIVESYLKNPLTKAIVFGGLEPFDSSVEMIALIAAFREKTQDPIIIYTGYTEEEILNFDVLSYLKNENIIIKFGRFIPNQTSHYDKILGVNLASDNQYAKKI